MKRIALVLMAIVVVSAVAFSGDMAKQGAWGVQTSLGFASATGVGAVTTGWKFRVSDNMAVRAEVGFSSFSPAGGGGSSSGYGFGAGFEYHWNPSGMGNVSPYVGAGLGYGGSSAAGGGTSPTSLTVGGFVGGEYFFSSNFSVAGQVGLGFNSAGVSGATNSTIGTMNAAGIWTWYLSN